MIALFKVESNFGTQLKGHYRGELIDYGWGQINVHNIKRLDLNINRLVNDIEYSIEESVKFMASVKRSYIKSEPANYYSRYHSGTPKFRRIYEDKIINVLKSLKITTLTSGYMTFKGFCSCHQK